MDLPWSDLQGFAGATGVGAVVILAAFLTLDGLDGNLFPSVETYAKTGTWAIVATVPTLAFSYVLGLMTIGLGHVLVHVLFGIAVQASDSAVFRKDTFVVAASLYRQALQEADVLAGSALALLLLAAGALVEQRNLPSLKRVIRLATILTAAAAIGAAFLAAKRANDAHAIATAVRQQGSVQ
jgi:hypothetical protein